MKAAGKTDFPLIDRIARRAFAHMIAMIHVANDRDDADKLPRKLPPGTVVAHKTGSTNQVRTDAGIIYVPDPTDPKKPKQPVAVCVLTNENEDQRWVQDNAGQVVIADIGRAVYDHFAKKPAK